MFYIFDESIYQTQYECIFELLLIPMQQVFFAMLFHNLAITKDDSMQYLKLAFMKSCAKLSDFATSCCK